MKTEFHENTEIEPYKILFPLGILSSVLGVLFWLLFQYRYINYFPKMTHGNLMYYGFLWSFIAGFLMTAIPKMTSTFKATYLEIGLTSFLVFIQIVLSVRNEIYLATYLAFFQIIFVVIFAVRRFIVFKKMPFSGFMFLPAAFFMGLMGVLLFTYSGDRSAFLLFSGEALVLNLIIGLGSRLIPVISRMPNSLLPTESSKKIDSYLITALTVLLLNLSYFLDYFINVNSVGVILRAIVLVYFYIQLFKIHQKPVQWTVVGIGLKISLILLFLGTILSFQFFEQTLAAKHLIYIGGFSLITLLISTRVILAHGGQDLTYEVSSKNLIMILLSLILTVVLRYSIGNHVISTALTGAVIFFIIAMLLWIKKMYHVEFFKK